MRWYGPARASPVSTNSRPTLEDVYLELVGEAGVRDDHDLADAEAAA